MQRIHFILLQGFIVFHRGITFTLGPNDPFGRSISLNSAPPRPQTEAAARAQRRPLYKQCPTPTANRGSSTRTAQAIIIVVAHPDRKPRQRHAHSAGYYYSSSPPRPQTEAVARAQRRLYYRSSPTPISNRGSGTCAAQAILIEVAPAESRSAGCGARRKAVRLSGRRHGVAPWASVKLPLRPAFPSKARACP